MPKPAPSTTPLFSAAEEAQLTWIERRAAQRAQEMAGMPHRVASPAHRRPQTSQEWTPISSLVSSPNSAHSSSPGDTSMQLISDPPPPARCLCGGTGWYKLALDRDDPRFGVLYPCCCTLERRALQLRADLAALDTHLGRAADANLSACMRYTRERTLEPIVWQGQVYSPDQQRKSLTRAIADVTRTFIGHCADRGAGGATRGGDCIAQLEVAGARPTARQGQRCPRPAPNVTGRNPDRPRGRRGTDHCYAGGASAYP